MSDRVHPEARGFSRAADAYERGRPDYPHEAVAAIAERLGLRPGRTVLDLAAGTGKLTRPLVATGARVVAMEPLSGMRARLPEEAETLDGVAEAIPLPDASVDGVTVGQAFHWFRAPEALAEIHRVLRPGGALALVWNTRDENDELQAAISAVLEPHRGGTPWRRSLDPAAAIDASGLFGPVEELRLPHGQDVDANGLVDRFLSVSFVASAPEERRDEIEGGLRALVQGRPEPIRIAYTTEVFVARRLQSEAR